eukprot:7975835-Heterocapsa_arctica.AAC.1
MKTHSVDRGSNLCRGTHSSGNNARTAAPKGTTSPGNATPCRRKYGDATAPGLPRMLCRAHHAGAAQGHH